MSRRDCSSLGTMRPMLGSALYLTCDNIVTYTPTVGDDLVFKALADPTRRALLDLLYQQSGQNLSDLESHMAMTRFGVMKHLRVLEEAGLVVSRKIGRNRLHYLNPVPIRQVYDRWIDKYTENEAAMLTELKRSLEAG